MNIRHLEGRRDARAIVRINAVAWRAAYDGILPEETLTEMESDPSDEQVQRAFEQLSADRDGILVAEDDDATVRGSPGGCSVRPAMRHRWV